MPQDQAELRKINSENQSLKDDIKALNNQFAQAAFEQENEGGGAVWVAGDVADVYALRRPSDSLPRKLDTITKNELRQWKQQAANGAFEDDGGGDDGADDGMSF